MEWDELRDLKKKLKDPDLSTAEYSRLSNAFAYHASVLNKLLAQKGESPQFNNVTLGDFVKDIDARYLKIIRILGDDKQLIAQMNEQQCEYLEPKTAQERIHLKFWHPQGRHDDQLMSLALACRAATRAPPPGVGAAMLPH
jgi:hypothetical protein